MLSFSNDLGDISGHSTPKSAGKLVPERCPDIYKWFTETFDTADLKDAKALLEELSVEKL